MTMPPPPNYPPAHHPSPNRQRTWNTIIISIAAACIVAIITTGVILILDDGPDLAACKAAMIEQLKASATNPTPAGRPEACNGIDDATTRRLAGEAMNEWMEEGGTEKAFNDAFASPTP